MSNNNSKTIKKEQLLKSLQRLISEIVREELEEQNSIAAGGIVGGSASPLLFFDPKSSSSDLTRKKSIKEVNSVSSLSANLGTSTENIVSSYVFDVKISEDNQDNIGAEKQKKRGKNSKNTKSSIASIILHSGDATPGSLPRAKYIALEENFAPIIVKITCEKRPSEKYLEVLKAFIAFCHKKLHLNKIPHIHLHTTSKPYMTTGSYLLEDGTIHVLVKNRLLVDVLRTLAHELTHRKQHENGMLERELAKLDPMDEMGDINTPYENEAYEKSGNIVKEFLRTYKNLSKDELFSLHESLLSRGRRITKFE